MSSDQNGYNKTGMIIFVISMLASFGIMIYVAFLSGGIDLKEVRERAAGPKQEQAAAAPGAVDVTAVKDPWMPSDPMLARGKQLFAQNCAMCHGTEGKGDGPAGASLNPKPRNFVEGKWKKGGTRLGLMGVLQNGLPPSSMQSYKHLPINDRWALVHFVRSITHNLVKDNDADVAAKAPSIQ
jgi:mono/diheme cytochrome c family protein